MLAQIEEFIHLLRKSGVRISSAEVIDAARAVRAIGVRDSRRVRAALAASLVKTSADRPAFDELWDLYFHRFDTLETADADSPALALARQAGLPAEQTEALARELLAAGLAMSALARAGMGLGSEQLSSLIRAAAAQIELDDIRSPLQVGFYSYRMAEALGLGQAEAEAQARARQVVGRMALEDDAAGQLSQAVADGFGQLRLRLRSYVQNAFNLENRDFARDLALDALSDKPLTQLSDKEIAELRREVARLAELMRARLSLRPEMARRGRLDLRRTLRRSLATGGVPFSLPRKRRRRHRPKLVVLCDISDSVRAVSRFMLQLVYTLQELFDRVQTFAFVADLGELTGLFRQYELERAIELTYQGAVVSTFANSNYGHTLAQFAAHHLDRVSRRTTVMIIGDGRNNYHPSRASVLGDMRRRAKQVLWLNPEPPSMWGFGDSVMNEYQPHCDRVMVVRNLSGLRKVVDHLLL